MTFTPFGVPKEYNCSGWRPIGNSFSSRDPAVGRLIPAGTGYAYHQKRKAKRAKAENADNSSHTVTASDVEHALSEALNADNHDQVG